MVMSLESPRYILRGVNLTKPREAMPMDVGVTIEARTLAMTIGGELITYQVSGYEEVKRTKGCR
jgi:hypothetical protein